MSAPPVRVSKRIFLGLVLAAAGCATHASPGRVLTRYLAAESEGRYDDAWALLDPEDQVARNADAFAKDHVDAGFPWLTAARLTAFDVSEPAASADAAQVQIPVTAHHPRPSDVAGVLQRRLGTTTLTDADKADLEDRVELGARVVIEDPVPVVDEALTYTLRRTDDAWRVWLGLGWQDQALAHAVEATRAEQRGDVSAARAAWEAVLTVPVDPQGAVAALHARAKAALGSPESAAKAP